MLLKDIFEYSFDEFGLPYIYHPPEVFKSSNHRSASVDGRAFDIYSFGLVCLYCFTRGWYESRVRQCHSWKRDVYPLLFHALQLPFIRSQIALVFLKVTVKKSEVVSALNLVRAAMRIHPECRPEASALLQHGFFSSDFEKTLDTDMAWERRGIWPENESRDIYRTMIPESYNPSSEHFSKCDAQAINDIDIINAQRCDKMLDIVQEDSTRPFQVMEILKLQRSEHFSNTVPDGSSQDIHRNEVANGQIYEHFRDIVSYNDSRGTYGSDALDEKIYEDNLHINQTDEERRIFVMKVLGHAQDSNCTNMSNFQISEHFPEINSKRDPTAICNMKVIKSRNSDSCPETVQVMEILKPQSSEHFLNLFLEGCCSQDIHKDEVANGQNSKHFTDIVPNSGLRGTHGSDLLNVKIYDDYLHIDQTDEERRIFVMKVLGHVQDSHCTNMSNFQIYEHFPEINSKRDSTAIYNMKVRKSRISDRYPETAQVMKVLKLQSSGHLSNAIPEICSQGIHVDEVANGQNSEHFTDIAPNSDLRDTHGSDILNVKICEDNLHIDQTDDVLGTNVMKIVEHSQDIHCTNMSNFQIYEHFPEINSKRDSSAIYNIKVRKSRNSDRYPETVQVTEILKLQSSEHFSNTVPESCSQDTQENEIAHGQNSEHFTDIAPNSYLRSTHGSDILNVKICEDNLHIDQNDDVRGTNVMKIVEHSQDIHYTNMSNFQIYEHFPDINSKRDSAAAISNIKVRKSKNSDRYPGTVLKLDSKAIYDIQTESVQHSEYLPAIATSDNTEITHDTKITKLESSGHEQFNELSDVMPEMSASVSVNEEPRVLLKETRPRRNLFRAIRKWRIWNICKCGTRKSQVNK